MEDKEGKAKKVSKTTESKMKKVLVYGLTPNIGGLETYIIYQYRVFDESKLHLDFINEYKGKKVAFTEEILSRGSKIYDLTNISSWYHFLKTHKNEYDIIIFNTVNPFILYMLELVKIFGGFKKIIIHSHNGGIDTLKIVKKISYPAFLLERARFNLIKAEKWACSDIAAKWMFGSSKNCTIIKNGIDTEKFKFKDDIRKEIRKELSISDNDYIIGHVGRFAQQKNHVFLIDIFYEASKIIPNTKLLLIGDTVGSKKIKTAVLEKIKKLKLESKIIMLGMRKDTDRLYQAMDIFLLPSLYEGLPVVGVEAQCSGLPVIFSNTITKEAQINDDATYLPITDATLWAEKIKKISEEKKDRSNCYLNVIRNGFDVNIEAKRVEKLLLQ